MGKERKTGKKDKKKDRKRKKRKILKTVPPHILVTNFKPDVFIVNEVSREVIIFELTCP